MSNYKLIPIEAAKQISRQFEKDQVIIVTWDQAHNMQHVVTYGRTCQSSAQAAEGGNFVKAALGWPDRLCHETPDWWETGTDKLKQLTFHLHNSLHSTHAPISTEEELNYLKTMLDQTLTKLKEIYVDIKGDNPWWDES